LLYGTKDLVFEVNGDRRVVTVKDKNKINLKSASIEKIMADPGHQYEIGNKRIITFGRNSLKIYVKEGKM